MANIDNPVVVVGQQATLITKTITANGDYAASTENADGYSSVHVEVPVGETVYYSTFDGAVYTERVVIPEITINSFAVLRDCANLKSIRNYSHSTQTTVYNLYPSNPALEELIIPYLQKYGNALTTLPNKTGENTGVVQLGSVGYPVTNGGGGQWFGWGSGGLGWTVTLYVDPEDYQTKSIYTNKPFGAPSLSTLIYKSAVDGSTLETFHFPLT